MTALLRHVLARGDAPAILVDDSVYSWRALDDASRAFADSERLAGVSAGDRVVVVGQTGLDVVVAALAHHRAGVVHVPLNPAYGAAERAHIVDDSGARLVLDVAAVAGNNDAALATALLAAVNAAPPALRPPEARTATEELALLIYTSGTTGKAKGCALTFANVDAAVGALASLWEIGPDDEIVHALPLFHVHGLCVALHAALMKGARTRLLPKFTPAAVVDAVARGGTVFMGVPTMYRRLLDHLEAHPGDADVLKRARLFTAGSAPLPAADLEELERRTGHRIVERYGMSETLITLSNPLHGARKAGTVGLPLAGVRVRVVDDELHVQGPGVMRGYWNDPEATARAFDGPWLKTGDAAAVDADGYVTIRGRLSTDFVKVGGYKVSTREVEDALAGCPGVKDVAVVGAPDREWGQRVVAVVVGAVTLARLQQHAQLAAHKLPRGLLVVDALPRNAMGKVQKKLLEARVVAEGCDT